MLLDVHEEGRAESVDARIAALLKEYGSGRDLLAAAHSAEMESAERFLEDKLYLVSAISASEAWPIGDVAALALRMHAGASKRELRTVYAGRRGGNAVIDRLVPVVTPDVRLERGGLKPATVPMTLSAWLGVGLIVAGVLLPVIVATLAPIVVALSLGATAAGVLVLAWERLGS